MHKMKKIVCILLCAIILISTVLPVCAKEGNNQRTIKIGYFDSYGYHNMDEDGSRSGYGYEFYQMMLRYANWNYEYIGFEQSWSGILDMLDRGEVDVVTLANKTPEREEKYLFSDKPIGAASTIMTVNEKDTDIIAGDYTTYNGKRVGLVKNSSHNAGFEEFAKEHGFTYTVVCYDSATDVLADLRNGENIDIAVTSNMRVLHDEVVLDEFNAQPFYAITRKENTDLMKEINQGIAQLNINSPNWQTDLWGKYFGTINENVIALTPAEREYIDYLNKNHIVIKAAMNPELRPYSYFENGEPKGIAARVFAEVADKLGITYEILESKDRWEYKEQLNSGEANIDLTSYLNFGQAQRYNLKETDAYITSCMAMLSRKNSNMNPNSMIIAGLKDPTEFISYNDELLFQHDYVEYNSIKECIDAVKRGKADATYRYVYVAEQAVAEDYTNTLQYTIMSNYSFSLAIGVNDEEDYRLLSILNKGVNSITDQYVQRIILEETAAMKTSNTLLSLIYSNPIGIVVMITVLCFLLYLCIFLRIKSNNLKKSMQQEKELERFVGYVCKANEEVMEVNLKEFTSNVYTMKDGHVICTKIPYQQMYGQNSNEVICPEDYERIRSSLNEEEMDQMIDGEGGERYFECRCKTENGEYEWFSFNLQTIPKSEKYPRNFILFKKNINQLKQDEEKKKQALSDALGNARNASEAKGQFLSKMSHEIRTPLNAVIGYMGIAEDSEDNPEKVMHCVRNTKIASEHLLSIINNVLDMSAIESGKMKIAHDAFNLKEQLTTISSIFDNQARQKEIVFISKFDEVAEEAVLGDKLRMNQVFMNLLSNAVKFTPKNGTITFEASPKKEDEDKIFVTFRVSDTGIGMSKEYQERLFQPFEQESAVTAQKYGGTGLGLSITNNLVNLMGGSIEAVSRPGEGSTFVVSLSFDRSLEVHPEPAMQQDFSGVRVLIVDDDKAACESMRSLFKRCKVKCDVVSDGETAIKRIKGRMTTDYAYNLCLMDWNMPKMDGIETARRIRSECDPKLPIMIATADDVTELADQARELGVNQMIAKPLFQSTMFDLLVTTFGTYKPVTSPEQEPLKLAGLRVLLAEDNPMNLEIAIDILKKAGLLVDPATDGQQAVDRFLASPAGTYNAILMDIQMPVLDGYQATGVIRRSAHPEAASIPIIAMTANAFAEDVNAALASGMNGHVSKPVDYKKLYQVLYDLCIHREEKTN